MASRSSRRKSGSSVSLEHAQRLLHDGDREDAPAPDLIKAAESLQSAGVVRFQLRRYVRCANRGDRDFERRPNRNCDERIYLVDGLDENEDAFVCPSCDRPVYPRSDGKEVFSELTVELVDAGVERHVAGLLAETFGKDNVRQLDSGVYRVDADGGEATVCIVDTMGQRHNRLQSLSERCHVLVQADSNTPATRLPAESWLMKVTLAELIAGTRSIAGCVHEALAGDEPRTVTSTIPIFSANRPIQPTVERPPAKGRRFVVEVRENTVLVEDVVVVNPQAGPRHKLFTLLWDRFVADLAKRRAPGDFTRLSVASIADELGYEDVGNARRLVNNLQSDIADQVRKQLGLPIDREDIVETCRMKGQSDDEAGYRLNPFIVAIRPPQA